MFRISRRRRPEDKERALHAGSDDYPAKPYRIAQLYEIIEKHLDP